MLGEGLNDDTISSAITAKKKLSTTVSKTETKFCLKLSSLKMYFLFYSISSRKHICKIKIY